MQVRQIGSRQFITLTAALLLTAAATAFAQRNPELSDARIAVVAQMLPEKPAGFGVPCSDRTAWSSIASHYDGSVEKAKAFITSPLPGWSDDAYLLFSRTGDRKVGEAMLHSHDGQLGPLVLAECSEWKGRFLPRIAEELDAISAQKAWTEPAHDPRLENFHQTRYFVDLNAASLGHAVAEALYLLGNKIPEATRKRAMEALELHMFAPTRRSLSGIQPDHWLHVDSNWNAVCLNGTVDAALTILPDRNDRALFAAAAEHYIANYMKSFKDSGFDVEGIGYWVYGFSNFEQLREQLWLSTSGRIDLFDDAKARKAALFGFQFAMLPGVYAPFADAHFGGKPDPAFLAEINRIFQLGMVKNPDAALASLYDRELPTAVEASFPNHSEWHGSGAESTANLIGIRTYYDDAGILIDHPAPGGDLAITIKAAGNGPHSHNDIGSYSIGLRTTQPLGDPGGPSFYTADTFSPRRFESRLLNSFGHPVPEVDGHLQLDATKVQAPILSTHFTPEEDSISIDITAAYNDPNLKKLVRTMHYSRKNGGSVEIEDNFDVSGPAQIVESLPTHGTWQTIDANTLQFDDADAHLQVKIEASSAITFTQDKIDDYGNPFTRVGAHLHIAKSGKVVMHFHPVSAQ
ncbi:MAG TPA: hypothetical protein VMV98_07070 [Acidobacteriaceae bacterium]|nr:hypothetical protein [Acidobacteriaceae bacterium]